MNQINEFRDELDMFKNIGLLKPNDSNLNSIDDPKNQTQKSNFIRPKPKPSDSNN